MYDSYTYIYSILELLRESGSVDVGDLSLRLRVSAVTIRKDLDQLEERQLLYRTHGGAVLADPYIATRKVSEKEKLNPELKHRIGQKAAELLSPQEALIIASGTTVQAFARCIQNMKMTVITSAMNVAMELLDKPDIEIIQLGGHYPALIGIGSKRVCGKHAGQLYLWQTVSRRGRYRSGVWAEYDPFAGGLFESGDDRYGDEDDCAGRLIEIRASGIQQNMRYQRHRSSDYRFGSFAENFGGHQGAGSKGYGGLLHRVPIKYLFDCLANEIYKKTTSLLKD